MAWYSQGNGDWSTWANWNDAANGSGSAATQESDFDGVAVVIQAGHAIRVDDGVDHNGNGVTVTGITITSHATTPGRLYWDDTDTGGNIACSGDIAGTDAAAYGQLVATADGTLADTDPLSYANKAIIRMSGSGSIDCTYLDVNMLPDEPTNFYVTPFLTGSKQDFNAETGVSTGDDEITINSHGLSQGDVIGFHALSGSLPSPLRADTYYYVRNVDTNTFSVAYANSDASIVDITAVGSGTCCIYEGADTTNPVPIIEDVSSDNWEDGDAVVLVNIQAGNYDQQRLTILEVDTANEIELSAAPDSSQNPGARIYLSTMNCSILHSADSSSQNIVENGSDGRFGEIRATAGSGTSFDCYGIRDGSNHTVTTISGCNNGLRGSGCTVTTISGCYYGIYYGSGCTATTVSGCNNGIHFGSGCTATTVSGCSNGIYSGSGNIATTISGCNYGIRDSSGNTATTISGCSYGLRDSSGCIATIISGCDNGIYRGSGCTAATISGCTTGIYSGSHNSVSNLSGNSTDFDETYIVYASGGIVPAVPTNGSDNEDGEVSMMFSENHAGVFGAQKIIQSFGDATKVTAGDGTPIPNQRSGGNATLIELSNLKSNLSGGDSDNKVIAWEPGKVRVYATSGVSKTYTFYVQSTFAISTAADFKLIGKYHASGSDTEWTTTESDETITARDDIDDWDQYVEVTINPSRTGWITFDIELRLYNSGGKVFIDPLMVIS